MEEPKITAPERVTMRALESNNPFNSTIIPKKGAKKVVAPTPIVQEIVQPDPEPEIEIPEDSGFELEEIEPEPEPKPEPSRNQVGTKSKAPFSNPIVASRSKEGLPSYRAEWAGRDIFIGFPAYKTTNPVTAWVLVALALDFGKDKIRFDMELGDAMVYHARNRLADKFLETDAKWMLMLDDDIIPAIGRPGFLRNMCRLPMSVQDDALNRHVLHRLIGANKTLIGGAYFGRQAGGRLMTDVTEYENEAKIHSDKVVKAKWVGTGCMLVHRKVFEDIKANSPELQPKTPGQPFDYFRPMGNGVGEDVSFCHRAAKAGHDTFVDLGLPVYHVGYHCYGAGTV
jgi:hypothetical protein